MRKLNSILLVALFAGGFFAGLALGSIFYKPVSAYYEALYIPWQDKAEIKEWVKSTGIPDRPYVPEVYDCDDTAIELWIEGMRDERLIGLLITYDTYSGYRHFSNFTFIGNNQLYRIETHPFVNIQKFCQIDNPRASIEIWELLNDYYMDW